ncbi:hypothetical protein J4456_02285 [Candidatus Pacearchaeota archaeon]|nr:hypothetical protein [Candidatus Pacearchaeota archaeon]
MTNNHKNSQSADILPFISSNADKEELMNEIENYERFLQHLPDSQDYKIRSLRDHYTAYLQSYCQALKMFQDTEYMSPLPQNKKDLESAVVEL